MAEQIAQFGEFKFLVPVAKAVTENGELFVEGVASSTGLDKENDIITAKGQASMASWANSGTVVLGGEADHFSVAFDDDLGIVQKGEVLTDGSFFVRAKLDKDNPRAVGLHKKLADGAQLGLSVFGRVTKPVTKSEDGARLIDEVALSRITVTKRPVNPDTWLGAVAKSLPAVDPEEEPKSADAVAKGKFLDLLNEKLKREAEQAPIAAQFSRVSGISKLVSILYDAAYELEWAKDLTPDQKATAIAGAIDEFKATVMAKAETDDADAEGGDPPLAKSEDVADEAAAEETEEAEESEAPDTEADAEIELEETEPAAKAAATESEGLHPGTKVAKSFADAARMLFESPAEPRAKREGAKELVGKLAADLDEALPEQQAEAEAPAWAAKLMQRIDALEHKLDRAGTGAVSAPADGTEDAGDIDLAKARKSVDGTGSEFRPSRAVAKAQDFHDIVNQLFGGGAYPAKQ